MSWAAASFLLSWLCADKPGGGRSLGPGSRGLSASWAGLWETSVHPTAGWATAGDPPWSPQTPPISVDTDARSVLRGTGRAGRPCGSQAPSPNSLLHLLTGDPASSLSAMSPPPRGDTARPLGRCWATHEYLAQPVLQPEPHARAWCRPPRVLLPLRSCPCHPHSWTDSHVVPSQPRLTSHVYLSASRSPTW